MQQFTPRCFKTGRPVSSELSRGSQRGPLLPVPSSKTPSSSSSVSQTHLSPLQLHHHHLQSLKNTCTSSILYKSIIQNKAFHCVEYSCRVLSVNACFSCVCVCACECVYACVHSDHILMLFILPAYKKTAKNKHKVKITLT